MVWIWKNGEANLGDEQGKQPLYTKWESKNICSYFICMKKHWKEMHAIALTSHILGTWVMGGGQVPILSKGRPGLRQ